MDKQKKKIWRKKKKEARDKTEEKRKEKKERRDKKGKKRDQKKRQKRKEERPKKRQKGATKKTEQNTSRFFSLKRGKDFTFFSQTVMTTTMFSSSSASSPSFTNATTSSSSYSSSSSSSFRCLSRRLRRFYHRRHHSRKCETTTNASTTTSRRTVLVSLGVVVVSSSTTNIEAANAGEMMVIDSRTFVSRAMQKFERNDVEGATMDFDALIEKSPGSKPYLWQRGIALYYVDEFREAEKQFREDVRVNPNDTEEAAWAFLSQMRKGGEDDASSSSSLKKAREEFVELAGRDSRKVMGSVLRLYKTGDEEAKKTLESLSKKPADSTQSASDAFYASLYLGLYSEALGNAEEAKYWVKKANGTPYGQRASGDFMTSVAKVHLARRKWDVVDEDSDKRTTGGNVEVVSTHAFDSATRRLERFPFPESYSMRIV